MEKVDPVRVRAVIRQLPTALTPPSSVQTHGRSGNGTRKREGKLVLMTSHGEEEDVSLRGNYAGDADAGQIKHGRGNGDNEMGGMSCVGDLEPGQRQGQGQNKELTVSDYTIFDACTQHPAFLLSIRYIYSAHTLA